MQIGTAVWNDPEILPTAVTAHEMDGRLGWRPFEGKTVKVDYDANLLIISSSMPKDLKGYTKIKLEFIRSLPCIKGHFLLNDKDYNGYFVMDTGSEQAIILDGAWVDQHNFTKTLKTIKSSVLRDPKGVQYETKIVLAPLFKFENFSLPNIPTLIIGGRSPGGIAVNYLGNDLLKRFNIILDFKHDCIYFKSNKLLSALYRQAS